MQCINWKGREMTGLRKLLKKILYRFRGIQDIEALIDDGMIIGERFWCGDDCSFDSSFCWLITIGNNVTFSNRVQLIAHDASIHDFVFKTKIGKIVIDDYAFIGARSLILPGVHIGTGAVVAAGSLVNKDIPPGEVWGGVPARKIMTRENLEDKSNDLQYKKFKYDGISEEERLKLREEILKELSTNKKICFLE